MSLIRTVPPALPPVSLPEVKQHLRVDADDEDDEINGLIQAAVKLVEDTTWLQLITATWQLKLDSFPDVIYAPRGPLQSATIAYVDDAGASQTLGVASYTVDAASHPGRIYPAYGYSWPSVRCQPGAVTLTLVNGYGTDPADVPGPIRTAILMLTAHLYENRGLCDGPMPEYLNWLLNPYRMTYARGVCA